MKIEFSPETERTYTVPEKFTIEDHETGLGLHVVGDKAQLVGYSDVRDQFDSRGFVERLRAEGIPISVLLEFVEAYQMRREE